jgi:hypothetical protein
VMHSGDTVQQVCRFRVEIATAQQHRITEHFLTHSLIHYTLVHYRGLSTCLRRSLSSNESVAR